MNILVIGGTGYMGKIMVERLLDRGDRVTVFSRGTIRPGWWSRVSHIPGDRNDAADFNAKLKALSFDAVVDTQAYRWEDVQSAVETLRGNVGRYLLVSTSSVYLDGKVDFFRHCPYDESAVEWSTLEYTYPEGEDPYAVGKRHCEKWLLAYCNQLGGGIPYTIIRIPGGHGTGGPHRANVVVGAASVGRRPGGRRRWDAGRVQDAVQRGRGGELHPDPGRSRYHWRRLFHRNARDSDPGAVGGTDLASRRTSAPSGLRLSGGHWQE